MNYVEYRKTKGRSITSINSEIITIDQLNNFLNLKYKKKIEAFEIKPQDIHDFLNQQIKINKPNTVNKKIVYLRAWFNYLWETKQITYDFMCKIPFFEVEEKEIDKTMCYEELVNNIKKIAQSNAHIIAKLIYIFFIRGLQPRDIYNIKLNNIHDLDNKIKVEGIAINKKAYSITFETEVEMNLIRQGIERAVFGNTEYLFNSRIAKSHELNKLIQENTSVYIAKINEILDIKFTHSMCKSSYIYYLFTKKNKRIEEIALILSTTIVSVTAYLNKSIDLNKKNDYNVS